MNTKASFIVLLLLLLHQLLLDKPLYQGVYYYSFSTNWFIGICHFKSAKLCRSSYDMHEHHHLAPTEQLIRLIAWHHGPLEGNRGIPWRRRGEVLSRMTRGRTPSYPFNFIKSYCGCHYKNTTGSNEQFQCCALTSSSVSSSKAHSQAGQKIPKKRKAKASNGTCIKLYCSCNW